MALKNIDNEIKYLLDEINLLWNMKEQIISFNAFVKSIPNALAITQYKFDELSCQNLLNEDTIYYICPDEIAQYIDGCII